MQRARGFFQAVVFQGTEIRRPQKKVDKQNGQTGATKINDTKFTVDLHQNNRYQKSKRTITLVKNNGHFSHSTILVSTVITMA